MTVEVPERMPRSVKFALVGVWVQVVVNFLGGSLIYRELSERSLHNQDVPHVGLVRVSVYGCLVAALVLAVAGTCARRRFRWVWTALLVVEAVGLLNAVFSLVVLQQGSSIVGVALTVGIGSALLGLPGRTWFHH